MKNKFIVPALAIIFALSGCGYDGTYRYACQDPENFDAPECNPPLCKVTGTCTIDILGFDPKTGEIVQEESVQNVEE